MNTLTVFFLALGVLVNVAFATNAQGTAFLAAKEKEEGVVKLPSGLMYKVLKKGDGKHHPTKDSPCDCHYAGTLIDGTEFDSSYKRGTPTTFAPQQVIKGWTEAMQLMVEGDKWEMYIPSELAALAIFKSGTPLPVPIVLEAMNMSTVIFLALGVLASMASATNAEGKAYLEAKEKEEGVVKLPSGLLYKVLKTGDGKHHPTKDSPCDCHYAGTLIDGTEFDSSYKRGKPTTFAPNQVIKGWTEAMQLMVEGDKWEMYIPSELAYGDRGAGGKIPGGAALVFQMEIIKIKGKKVDKKEL
eukprot:CAMPEP_0197703286 /NCGR_PEP_ID=MMETSP1338-20131121/125361_1 /TAXON_ID=43686 ORGANISM="Pelagodinium beii, Strain RCC1491" /NCGR_SAMPLE_ID=MMETSP1338 /ASSEMBLY_ACC=CAM_ASM_000754 /LENGTH=298 /DNA_ID=CAMNT_0043287179 /DNA_START=68 /DNA_END=963 /DNA_ORIENTATION=-